MKNWFKAVWESIVICATTLFVLFIVVVIGSSIAWILLKAMGIF